MASWAAWCPQVFPGELGDGQVGTQTLTLMCSMLVTHLYGPSAARAKA